MSQASGGQEQVPVAFRYDVTPLESKRTHVFRPNNLSGSAEIKAASLGALFIGKWDKLVDSKMAKCIWEVGTGHHHFSDGT